MVRHFQTAAISGAVFLAGTLYALGLQFLMRPYALDRVYFHPWSSEDMMQTVPLSALRQHPIQSLTHIHIQPPAFDAIRAMLSQFWPSLGDHAVLVRVDTALYYLGAVLVGSAGAMIFIWLRQKCSGPVAGLAAMLFLLHPAVMLYATFLDSTLLSACLVLLTYFLLWQQSTKAAPTLLWLSFAALALFFTRSIFQWPALVLFGVCLFLIGVRGRGLLIYFALTLIGAGAYTLKQEAMFGIPWTSSLAGVNLSNSIGVGMGTAKYAAYLDDPQRPTRITSSLPLVLAAKTKLSGQPNFNNIDYLALNTSLLRRYQVQFARESISDLVSAYRENATIYFRPSSTYSSGNVIVERLPWRGAYDFVFSAPVLPIMLVAALMIWITRLWQRRALLQGAALFLPAAYILLASILGDRGENMRFKFFLEPVMYVFVVSQFYAAARGLSHRTGHAGVRAHVA